MNSWINYTAITVRELRVYFDVSRTFIIQMAKRNNYHDVGYWQQRYKQNICEWYEWLATPNQLSEIIQKYLKKPAKVLELGCGSSNLAQKMMALHHEAVTCIDFSKEVIKNKQKQAKDGVSYKVHDLMQPLPFDEGSFDAIVQKNTLDCLLCYEDFPAKVMRVMKQCYRVLAEGGVMISISHGKKKTRQFFYRNRFSPFSLQVEELGDLKPGQPQIYVYILTKGEGQAAEDDNQVENAQEEKQQNEGSQQNVDEAQQKRQNEQGQQNNSPEKQQNEQKQQNYEFDQLDGE